ncbi:MAG: DUF2752 domain-containing protein [Clostridia bacterium]|nr:DUF2752 domain-containing protein [Clostridia bacterium]
MKSLWSKYGHIVSLCGAVAFTYAIMRLFGISCPIKFLFGVSCPGCGMTRAFLRVLQLDFSAAFYYHPLWVIIPPTGILLFLFRLKKKETAFCITLATFCVLMFAVYFYRMLCLPQQIVVFAPENSLFSKIIRFLSRVLSFE